MTNLLLNCIRRACSADICWKQRSFVRNRATISAAVSGRMGEGIQAALIDLSGTLHIEDSAIPGAPLALQRLRDSGVKVKFVTNTTKESLRLLHDKVTSVGFAIERNEMFTSLTAARKLVQSKKLRPFLLLEDCAKEDFEGISEEDPNAVVVGLAPTCFDYPHMNKAFRLLLDGASLIAIHRGRYYQKKDGLYLGPGAFVSGLEYATDVTAEVVGKPQAGFFLAAVDDLGVKPQNTVMIGDDVRDDVGGALAAGMKAILVQTGKYREGDETKISPPATAVCQHFPAAVDYILANLRSAS